MAGPRSFQQCETHEAAAPSVGSGRTIVICRVLVAVDQPCKPVLFRFQYLSTHKWHDAGMKKDGEVLLVHPGKPSDLSQGNEVWKGIGIISHPSSSFPPPTRASSPPRWIYVAFAPTNTYRRSQGPQQGPRTKKMGQKNKAPLSVFASSCRGRVCVRADAMQMPTPRPRPAGCMRALPSGAGHSVFRWMGASPGLRFAASKEQEPVGGAACI